jgi:putative Mg2+ transporter-C (MgtC) family protein
MHTFFGITAPHDSLFGMSLPLLLAVVLGGLIGLEREIHGHPAGMRTHIIVCVGSTLITLVSTSIGDVNGAKGDPARLAAQIVSGIGFLGAGAILREGASIRGLTTAASVWTTAGIGIALGADAFYGQLAVIATAIVLFTLWILNFAEDWIDARFRRDFPVIITVRDTERAAADVLAQFADHAIRVESIRFEPGAAKHTREIHLRICPPRNFDRARFLSEMSGHDTILSIDLRAN